VNEWAKGRPRNRRGKTRKEANGFAALTCYRTVPSPKSKMEAKESSWGPQEKEVKKAGWTNEARAELKEKQKPMRGTDRPDLEKGVLRKAMQKRPYRKTPTTGPCWALRFASRDSGGGGHASRSQRGMAGPKKEKLRTSAPARATKRKDLGQLGGDEYSRSYTKSAHILQELLSKRILFPPISHKSPNIKKGDKRGSQLFRGWGGGRIVRGEGGINPFTSRANLPSW